MDSFSLSAADICRIIKQCHASGVEEFSFHGMAIKFHPHSNGDSTSIGQAVEGSETTTENFSEERDKAELMDNEILREAEEAQLLIDDPQAFEKSQIDRHIEKARMANGNAQY